MNPKDPLNYQRIIESISRYVYDNTEWNTTSKVFNDTLKAKQHDLKLRLKGEIG